MKIKKHELVYCFVTALYMVLAVSYYSFFVIGGDFENVVTDYVNIHDHNVYLGYIRSMEAGNFNIGFNNNFGISLFYYILNGIVSIFFGVSYEVLSLIVNIIVIVTGFIFFIRVLRILDLSPYYSVFYYLNFSLLYFSQLINKDSFTVGLLFLTLYLLLERRYLYLVLLIPLSAMLIRYQFLPFIAFSIFVAVGSQSRLKLVAVFFLCSAVSGVIAAYAPVISLESMSDGISKWFYSIGSDYFFAYFAFNILRVFIFYKSVLSSFYFAKGHAVDVSLLVNIPLVMLFLTYSLHWVRALANRDFFRDYRSRCIISCIGVYTSVWLINPTINIRYVMLILPVLVLLGIYRKSKMTNRKLFA